MLLYPSSLQFPFERRTLLPTSALLPRGRALRHLKSRRDAITSTAPPRTSFSPCPGSRTPRGQRDCRRSRCGRRYRTRPRSHANSVSQAPRWRLPSLLTRRPEFPSSPLTLVPDDPSPQPTSTSFLFLSRSWALTTHYQASQSCTHTRFTPTHSLHTKPPPFPPPSDPARVPLDDAFPHLPRRRRCLFRTRGVCDRAQALW